MSIWPAGDVTGAASVVLDTGASVAGGAAAFSVLHDANTTEATTTTHRVWHPSSSPSRSA